MSDYGMKVTQSGYSVDNALKEQMIFSSAYDTFKVYMNGSGTRSVSVAPDFFTSSKATVTIAHNLGYIPAFFCFSNNPIWMDSSNQAPYSWEPIGGGHNIQNYAVDTSNLYLTFYNSNTSNATTFEYRYFIFYNELA